MEEMGLREGGGGGKEGGNVIQGKVEKSQK